jgi:hypothetical protein
MSDDSEQLSLFESMGAHEVRGLVQAHRLNAINERLAIKWLAEKDQESARLSEASQVEQIDIARSAKEAAWAAARAAERAATAAERAATAAEKANTRATIALIIAIVSIIATIVGMWIVHRDSTRAPTRATLNGSFSIART